MGGVPSPIPRSSVRHHYSQLERGGSCISDGLSFFLLSSLGPFLWCFLYFWLSFVWFFACQYSSLVLLSFFNESYRSKKKIDKFRYEEVSGSVGDLKVSQTCSVEFSA